MADHQHILLLTEIGKRGDKLLDAQGEGLKTFAVRRHRILPVCTPRAA